MRTMDQQAGFNSLLARRFRIHCADVVRRVCGRSTSSARNYASTGRGRINIETARHLEWPHEIAEAALFHSFHDEIEGVLTLYDCLAPNFDPVLPEICAAKVIQEHGPRVGVLSGAAFGSMLMPDNEERHCRL